MTIRAEFRGRMRRPAERLTVAPLALDPMTALLARRAGFDAVYVGGGALGYALGVSEALLSAEDFAQAARRICERVEDVAVVVDGGVGFGDAVHVRRTVQVIENSGACAIEIEDQVAPKRAHHHKNVEHLVSKEEMCAKIDAACNARRDADFLIIARCNAIHHEGVDAAVERANAFAEAGADLLMLTPRSEEEFVQTSAGTKAPLATLSAWPEKSEAEMLGAGYAIFLDAFSGTVLTYRALDEAFRALRDGDRSFGMMRPDVTATMEEVKELIELETLYAIERATTERDA